jgi:hypothetical protein
MSVYIWSFAPGVRKTCMSANKIGMVLGVLAAATLLLGLGCTTSNWRMRGTFHIWTARLFDKYEGE